MILVGVAQWLFTRFLQLWWGCCRVSDRPPTR